MTVFEGLLDPSAQFDTVHAGHHDIRNDQIDRLSGQYTKRFFSVGCRFNSEIGRQKIGDQQEQFFVVIDDQQRMVSACAGGGIGHPPHRAAPERILRPLRKFFPRHRLRYHRRSPLRYKHLDLWVA